MTQSYVLVTGGCGYIGSHIVYSLLLQGIPVVVVDNLSTSSKTIAESEQIQSVIHCAGFKSVSESTAQPLKYYHNNLVSTLRLLDYMKRHSILQLIFSSSATVYGHPMTVPIPEDDNPKRIESRFFYPQTTSPYGTSKMMLEIILRDACAADDRFSAVSLRYFNPIGCHPDIGERQEELPNNLMPYLGQVLLGNRGHVNVYGTDYDTPDGSGLRDYIHVLDLANGHAAALKLRTPGYTALNLGTGTGSTVLQMIQHVAAAANRRIPFQFADRRPGDVDALVADPSRAHALLDWTCERSISDACKDYVAFLFKHQ